MTTFDLATQLASVRESLTQGWQIISPVLGYNAYVGVQGSVRAVEIVLTHQQQRHCIPLHDEQIVRQFLHEYGVTVIDL